MQKRQIRDLKRTRSRIYLEFFFFIVLKALFEWLFITSLSKEYAYCGSVLSINGHKAFVSWFVYVLFIFWVEATEDNLISQCLKYLFILSTGPSLSIYWMKNEKTEAFVLLCLYWVGACFTVGIISLADRKMCGRLFASSRKIDIPSNSFVIQLLFLWLIASTVYFSARYGGFRLFIRFEDVYTYRLDKSTQMGGIGGYLFSWNVNIFMPMCLMLFLEKKSYIRVVLTTLLFFMSYSIGGNKIILLICLLIYGVFFINKYRYGNVFVLMGQIVVSVVIVIGKIVFILSKKIMIMALTYRLLCIPAEAHYFYYDFFSQHELLYLRQSILRFIESPYNALASVIIGSSAKYYIGDYNNANNGLFSDAFQNFGVAGVLVYPIVIFVTLAAVLYVMRHFDKKYLQSIILIMCFYLYSAYYFSWLLTGGVIVLIVLILILGQWGNIMLKWRKKI